MTKNSSGKFFWTKYISILLATFVFLIGMMITGSAIAASDVGLNPIAYGTDSWGGYSYEVRIEGLQGIKYVNSQSYDKETRNDNFYTAKLVKDEVFKVHYIFNPVSLEETSATHKAGHVADKSMDKVLEAFRKRYKSRNWSISITLTAKEKDKDIKVLTKTFSNLTDNCVEYKLPPKTTQVIITVSGKQTLIDANKGRFTSEIEKGERYILVTTPIGSGNKKGSDTSTNTDKLSDNNSTGVDSGGNGIVYVGGGLFAVVVGGAAIFFYTGAGGAAGTGAAGSMPELPEPPEPEPEPPAPPPEPEYFNYKDPAGFETLYMKDPETGQWYNYQDYKEGYRVPVDMDKLQEYDAQRREDVKWNRDQMEKLENRETGLDKELKQEYQDMLEREKQIQQETKKDLYALQRGTFGMSNEERKTFLEERQAKDQEDVDKWTKRGETWDKITKTAEVVQKAADMGVDALAVATAPVGGQLIADVYTGAKNIGGNVMDAAVNHKNVWGAALKGAAQAGADIVQGHVAPGAKWTEKLGKYVASESLKEGIVAAVDGENAVKAALKGVLQGACKWGIEAAGDMVKGDYTQRAKNTMTQRVKQVKNMPGKSDISQKSLNELEALQYRRFIKREQELMVKQGLGQTITKETTSAIGDMAIKNKSFSEAEFGEKW